MEDENGIELSLGLSCGGSAGKAKHKDGSLDPKSEDGGGNKQASGNLKGGEGTFKNFFSSSSEKQDPSAPRGDSQDNFWTDLLKLPSQGGDASIDQHEMRSKLSRFHQDLWQEASSNKRKFLYEENQQKKKHEEEVEYIGIPVKPSHVSVAIEDGLSAENEVVAESEAEGSNSRVVLQHEEITKQYTIVGPNGSKFKDQEGFVDANDTDSQGLKQFSVTGNERANVPYGVSQFSLQPTSVIGTPYTLPVKAPPTPANSSFVPLVPSSNGETPIIQSMKLSNFPRPFGYPAVQLPTLEHFSAYASQGLGSGIPNADRHATVEVPYTSVEAFPSEGRLVSEIAKAAGKQRNKEETATCSSSHAEGESNGMHAIFWAKEISDQSSHDGVPYEGSAIRPGIAAGVKFGGCGSYPDLPWVSTTGTGPHGKTISGVTYRYGKNMIRIVCACHGTHMSSDEFVQHASTDAPDPENNTILSSFHSSNPAASAAQS
ncbi:protein NINJA homolog 1-like isoform X1 [Aristolochia californica]|uniref:protein NINJA homolog 1-like isoform X1 n=1 Tax=Aristolochia californica TaxID=171875 RepID=UPI0035E2CF5E